MCLNSYKNRNEPFFESIFRELRFGIAKKFLKIVESKNLYILDYGCGPEAKLYSYLKQNNIKFAKYVGYDPLSKSDVDSENKLISSDFKKISNNKYDLVTMFAVLEHLDYPTFNFSFLNKLLKKKGYLVLTTPTKMAKPVLEFLSYRLKLVSRREIQEHKHYFSKNEIISMFKKYHYKVDSLRTFELGMNYFVCLKK